MFKEALFTVTKTWKQHKCPPTDEWIKSFIYSVIKKKQNNAICSNMDTTREYHTKEVSQKEKYNYITYMYNLKYSTNEPIQRKTIEWERLEISSRKLEIPREHFMQRWAQKRTETVWT